MQAVIQPDGYKLIIGHVHQNIWTSWTYPNKSTSWDNAGFTDCSSGCLYAKLLATPDTRFGDKTSHTPLRPNPPFRYNIFDDMTEHHELSASFPDKVTELRARIAYHNSTMFRPNVRCWNQQQFFSQRPAGVIPFPTRLSPTNAPLPHTY